MAKEPFEPVRVGVVGLGTFGRLHAVTLSGLVEAEVVALVDPRAERVRAVGEEIGDVPGWCELHEALEQADAEAWVIASATASHGTVARTLLERGAMVLVEKPLTAHMSEAEQLAPLVAEGSRNLMVGHITLFNSEFRQLREELAKRGAACFIDAVRHRGTDHMTRYPGESPFRLTMVHDLYQVQALTGGQEPVSMAATLARRADGAPRLALAELKWANGTVARLTASFLVPEALGSQGFDRLEVFGEGWGSRLEPNPRPMEVWDDRVRWPLALELRDSLVAPAGMLAEELRCFCRVVRRRDTVPVGARYEDAVQIMQWLDRLERLVEDPMQPAGGDTRRTDAQ